MMHLLLLLLTQTAPAEHVLDRYVAFKKSTPQLDVNFTARLGNGPGIGGQAFMDSNKRLYMMLSAKGLSYQCVSTPEGTVEQDNVEQLYDEWPGTPEISPRISRLTGANQLFPFWLYSRDLREMMPKGTPFLIAPQPETVAGIKCDRLLASYERPPESGKLDLAVDPSGIVRRLRLTSTDMQGTRTFEWTFTRMQAMHAADASKFSLGIHTGYVPYALPNREGLPEVGQKFPVSGWMSGTGRIDLNRKLGAQGGVIALLGSGSAPSDEARASLAKIRKSVPVVVLTDQPSAVAGADAWDPSGQLIKSVNAPATPLFVLVDGTGKIRRMWMGFEPDGASAFETDVRNSFAEKE